MAGLYITFSDASSARLDPIANHMRHSSESECRFSGVVSYAWLGLDCADRYSPAIDSRTGVRVITGGRLVYAPAQWQRAHSLPYSGGLANRLILEKYLKSGTDEIAPFNGAACVVIWDPRVKLLHLWTDQFGYYPAFIYSEGAFPKVITSFPDTICSDSELSSELDEVSLAEFLRAWRVTPPHTYYRHLKHAGAACHRTWDLNSHTERLRTYWRPFETTFYQSVNEGGEELAVALKSAVHERTAAANKACLFVSGGADSRVMLFGADDPSKLVGLNIYETEPTAESVISETLCDRIGARYVGLARDGDYYPRMVAENVRWSGAMWSAEDSHYLGFKPVVDSEGVDLVMTACTTDWLFKGYGLERTYKQVLGKCLPLKSLLPERQDCFLPNVARPTPENLREAIETRFNAWFEGAPRSLRSDIDYLNVEDRRIRPTCYTVSVSGQMMYRVFPYSTFLADSRVAACYARTPAWMKLNGEIWGNAAGRICKGASDIVDANFGWSVNASTMQKLAAFGKGWIARRLAKIGAKAPASDNPDNSHPPCYASWPEYGWYTLNSPTVHKLWHETDSTVRQRLTAAWGSNPWNVPLEQWSHSPLDFFRLLTLRAFLESK